MKFDLASNPPTLAEIKEERKSLKSVLDKLKFLHKLSFLFLLTAIAATLYSMYEYHLVNGEKVYVSIFLFLTMIGILVYGILSKELETKKSQYHDLSNSSDTSCIQILDYTSHETVYNYWQSAIPQNRRFVNAEVAEMEKLWNAKRLKEESLIDIYEEAKIFKSAWDQIYPGIYRTAFTSRNYETIASQNVKVAMKIEDHEKAIEIINSK